MYGALFVGSTPKEVLSVQPDFMTLLGLGKNMTPSRTNGFLRLLQLMQKQALEYYTASEAAKEQIRKPGKLGKLNSAPPRAACFGSGPRASSESSSSASPPTRLAQSILQKCASVFKRDVKIVNAPPTKNQERPDSTLSDEIRKDFPILELRIPESGKKLVYLDNAASSQTPTEVINAHEAFHREYCANVHRGVHYLSGQATDKYEAARQKVR